MQVLVTPQAIKQLKHLPLQEQVKIKKKLITLEDDPLAGKKLSGELKESRTLRVWPYRILYYINHVKQKVFITSIVHRQGAYK